MLLRERQARAGDAQYIFSDPGVQYRRRCTLSSNVGRPLFVVNKSACGQWFHDSGLGEGALVDIHYTAVSPGLLRC